MCKAHLQINLHAEWRSRALLAPLVVPCHSSRRQSCAAALHGVRRSTTTPRAPAPSRTCIPQTPEPPKWALRRGVNDAMHFATSGNLPAAAHRPRHTTPELQNCSSSTWCAEHLCVLLYAYYLAHSKRWLSVESMAASAVQLRSLAAQDSPAAAAEAAAVHKAGTSAEVSGTLNCLTASSIV
jgi:hypothetical protein